MCVTIILPFRSRFGGPNRRKRGSNLTANIAAIGIDKKRRRVTIIALRQDLPESPQGSTPKQTRPVKLRQRVSRHFLTAWRYRALRQSMIAVSGFAAGVILMLAVAITLDSPGDREERLEREVARLAKVEAEFKAAAEKSHVLENSLALARSRLNELSKTPVIEKKKPSFRSATEASVVAQIRKYYSADRSENSGNIGNSSYVVAGGKCNVVTLGSDPLHGVTLIGNPDSELEETLFIHVLGVLIAHLDPGAADGASDWIVSAFEYAIAHHDAKLSRTINSLDFELQVFEISGNEIAFLSLKPNELQSTSTSP